MKVQTIRLKCDRCGGESSEHDADYVRAAWETMKLSGTSPERDLCPHCAMALGEWFKAVEARHD